MAALSFVLAFHLRVGDAFWSYPADFLILGTAAFTAIAAIVFLRMGLYRGIWRYASLSDLGLVARAVTFIILIFVPVMFLVTRLEALPRSLPFINWFVLLILLAGPRAAYRMMKDGRLEFLARQQQPPHRRAAGGGGRQCGDVHPGDRARERRRLPRRRHRRRQPGPPRPRHPRRRGAGLARSISNPSSRP